MSTAIVPLFKTAHEIQLAPQLFSLQTESVLKPDAVTKRDDIVAVAQGVECIKSPAAQQVAANCLVEIQDFLAVIEKGRVALKKPFDDFGKKIQQDVATLLKPVNEEKERLKKLLGDYAVEMQKKAADEQAKQDAEIRRLEAEQAALAEAPQTAENVAKQQEIATAMGENLKVVEAPKATGVSTRPVRVFKVVDIAKLYAARPDLVKLEERTAEINKVIRAEGNENLVIDGIEITTEMQVVPR